MTVTQLDQQALRHALGSMATPVVVVTATVDGRHHGFTANSFTSVSMEPPLLGVYLADTSTSYHAFMRAERAAINVLAHHQEDLAVRFAARGGDKFTGLDLDCGLDGAPAIPDTMVTFAGNVVERVVLGDHVLLLMAPTLATPVRHTPLIYHQRAFRRLPTEGDA